MPITTECSHHRNSRLDKASETAAAVCIENLSRWAEAVQEIKTWPEYEPQPLHSLPNHAKQMGISNLFFKDKSKRFGTSLGSSKALGAPYAVYKILADEVFSKIGIRPTSVELQTGKFKDLTYKITVCVAIDGN